MFSISFTVKYTAFFLGLQLYLAAYRREVNDPPKSQAFDSDGKCVNFLLCKLMQAPRFLSLFIHWEQMFLSLPMRRLSPFRKSQLE